MKFMVISKPNAAGKEESPTVASLEAAAVNVRRYLDQKVLDAAYAIIGGGSVYVVNVESLDQLEAGLRDHELTRRSDIEIHAVRDPVIG